MFIVIIAVRKPVRAQARAASQPAWPAPMTITSYLEALGMGIGELARPCAIRPDSLILARILRRLRSEAWLKVLVIGSGGREHAIAWKLAQSGHHVVGAPGNPGIAEVGTRVQSTDYLAVAQEFGVDLTVVGPEAPLVAGIVDEFCAAGRRIVGPTRNQARLEGSKVYAKQFMQAAGIPTAAAVHAATREDARRALDRFGYPIVVKADGLAAGKGVIIAGDRAAAHLAIDSLGDNLIVEECLPGEEVSFIVLSDGRHFVPLEATQDHKRIGDGDTGPNTGGMGAYCDGRILTTSEIDVICRTVIQPAVERTNFRGFLYAGLMMTPQGPKVLEFNVRLGDPETQPLMQRMRSDFGEILWRAANSDLEGAAFNWIPGASVCVVMAAAGYPGTPRTGDLITGLENARDATVFQAGTAQTGEGLVTAGGRVLGVTACAETLPSAIKTVYSAVDRIHFEGAQFRRDIGLKGLKRW
jgi:phosphoribosylamine--glycine ligase